MTRWTCPACDREFAKPNQAHVCVPGGTVDQTFAGYPDEHREIYDAVAAYLAEHGPVHADAVGVGVFLKTANKLAEIRPKKRWVALALVLPRRVDDPRIARHIRISAERIVHVIKLFSAGDVDDQIRAWLTEAYDASL
jgi:Domain of unknown function (DUF5655)